MGLVIHTLAQFWLQAAIPLGWWESDGESFWQPVSPPNHASSLHQFQSFRRPSWVLNHLSTPVTAYLPLACVSTILPGLAASGSFPDTSRTLESSTNLWNPVPRALLLQMNPVSHVWSLVASQGTDLSKVLSPFSLSLTLTLPPPRVLNPKTSFSYHLPPPSNLGSGWKYFPLALSPYNLCWLNPSLEKHVSLCSGEGRA